MPAGEWEAVALTLQGEVCEPVFEAGQQQLTIRLQHEYVKAVRASSFRHGGYPKREVVLQMRSGDVNYRGIRLCVLPTHEHSLGVCCVAWVQPDAGPPRGMVAISARGGVSAGLVQWVREELGKVDDGLLLRQFRFPFERLAALQRLGDRG